jgi:hypothetical protein
MTNKISPENYKIIDSRSLLKHNWKEGTEYIAGMNLDETINFPAFGIFNELNEKKTGIPNQIPNK